MCLGRNGGDDRACLEFGPRSGRHSEEDGGEEDEKVQRHESDG